MAADVEPVVDAPEAPEERPHIQYSGGASERGRYAVFETPDGGWKIVTRGPLCETCSNCGCGQDYREPLPVPPGAVKILNGGIAALPAPARALLGKVFGLG